MTVDDTLLANMNLSSVLRQLTVRAARWFLQEGCLDPEAVLPPTANSAKQLAFDVLTEFIKGNIEHDFDAASVTERSLLALLTTVMKHDFLDLVKEGRAYKRTAVLDITRNDDGESDENRMPTLDELPNPSEE